MEFSVDRDLPVPLRAQLQGLIEYGIACGQLAAGELLPSVRDLAERVGVAPMTVSQVYADLKTAGLIETRPGSGSFVTRSDSARLATRPQATELHKRIDALVDAGIAAGIRPAELVSLVSARAFYRDSIGSRTRIVMVGLFPDATASYARFIAARLGTGATVEPATIAQLERDKDARARTNSADLVVTFVNRQREVMALVTNVKVISISFIPSEETRKALAALDPMARVVVVSRFPDFLPIMKAGAQRFAPHVARLSGAMLDMPELASVVAHADVVVFASGAESVLGKLPAGVAAIEYRHAPDPAEIERVLEPLMRTADQLNEGKEGVVRVSQSHWQQIEDYLRKDDRCVLPLGSTEQHAMLSLSVDSILSERVAAEAAEPLHVPVFPVVAYGLTPYFTAYPGSITLRTETYVRLVRDILDGLRSQGFRRILICNGHGGNQPAGALAIEWMADNPDTAVKFHNWWAAPKTMGKVLEIDPVASHASWMENFPWTRLPGMQLPTQQKPMIDLARMRVMGPQAVRRYLGDGNFGGYYERPDEDMLAIWEIAVNETRALLEDGWA